MEVATILTFSDTSLRFQLKKKKSFIWKKKSVNVKDRGTLDENPQMFLHVKARDSFLWVASANKLSLDLVRFHALK